MSFTSTTCWLRNTRAQSGRRASLHSIVAVFTVLGNDARYVVPVHPSCRVDVPVSTANNERTRRHHCSRPPVLWSFAQARSVSSSLSVFPAGLAIPSSREPDRVGRLAACAAAGHGSLRRFGARFHRR